MIQSNSASDAERISGDLKRKFSEAQENLKRNLRKETELENYNARFKIHIHGESDYFPYTGTSEKYVGHGVRGGERNVE